MPEDEGASFDEKQAAFQQLLHKGIAGPTCLLVSGDTTVENMGYTIRLIYTGSAE